MTLRKNRATHDQTPQQPPVFAAALVRPRDVGHLNPQPGTADAPDWPSALACSIQRRLLASHHLDSSLDDWLTTRPRMDLSTALQIFLASAEGRDFAEILGVGTRGPASFRLESLRWHEPANLDPHPAWVERRAVRLGAGSPWFVFDVRTVWGSRVSPGYCMDGRAIVLPRRL